MVTVIILADTLVEVPIRRRGRIGFDHEHVPGRYVHAGLGLDAPTTVCGLASRRLYRFSTMAYHDIAVGLRCPDCRSALKGLSPEPDHLERARDGSQRR